LAGKIQARDYRIESFLPVNEPAHLHSVPFVPHPADNNAPHCTRRSCPSNLAPPNGCFHFPLGRGEGKHFSLEKGLHSGRAGHSVRRRRSQVGPKAAVTSVLTLQARSYRNSEKLTSCLNFDNMMRMS